MDTTPRRLKAERQPLVSRPQLAADDAAWASITLPAQRNLVRKLRAVRRGVFAVLWTLPCMLVQAVLLRLPGAAKVAFARFYWAGLCRAIGLQVRVIGQVAARTSEGRPVVFVSNHSSWLDVLALGSRLPACFIAKEQVGQWPVIGTIARLGRTVYVRRARSSTGRERDDMASRLEDGDNLILFPEGTSSDGARVMSFRSAFLSIAELKVTPEGRTPIIQPVSLVYDRLAGLPCGRATAPLFAWYGDMDIASHFWGLAQHQGLRATVLLHQPIDPEKYAGRKELTQVLWKIVAEGAATLRQNRPATPHSVSGPGSADRQPAFV
jgi:1-acyl-sn-glycerol-3-phosphate acyltransferase